MALYCELNPRNQNNTSVANNMHTPPAFLTPGNEMNLFSTPLANHFLSNVPPCEAGVPAESDDEEAGETDDAVSHFTTVDSLGFQLSSESWRQCKYVQDNSSINSNNNKKETHEVAEKVDGIV